MIDHSPRIRPVRADLAVILAALAGPAVPVFAQAGAPPAGQSPPGQQAPPANAGSSPLQFFLQGGGVFQFETNLDDGGGFDVGRLFIQPGATWVPNPKLSVSFAGAYSRDNYAFGGDQGLAALRPWDDVEGVRFGASIRWSLDDHWTIFTIPSLRWSAETGADLNDGFNGGVIAGASYKISDTLSIGPGLGVFSQIEDSASVFPILLIDWKIAESVSLRTGGGLGATRGPGLSIVWDFAEDWSFTLGGRYESFRFRLDDQGVAPRGVGEERSIPIFAGVTWEIAETAEVSVIVGVNFGGELRLEDEDGNRIAKEDYDPAAFVGLTGRIRF